MCIAPCTLPDGQLVACRNCWQCRENKINDFVGRCIAESMSAVKTHVVTLTYGRDDEGKPDHIRANLLTYSDVQKWLKRLRVEGYPMRYLVAGEYGDEKGRAHWHIVIFWTKRAPDIVLDKRVVQAWWDHGWSFWEIPRDAKAVRYACKYCVKDVDSEKQSKFMMSKIPPLGVREFERMARTYVAQGLAPQSLEYTFDNARKRNGEPIKFLMRGRAAEMFLEEYVREWNARNPGRHMPNSELVENYLDGLVPDTTEIQGRAHASYVHKPKEQHMLSYMADFSRIAFDGATQMYVLDHKHYSYSRDQQVDKIIDAVVTFDEKTNVYKYTDPKTGNVLYWAMNPKGDYQWQGVIGRGRAISDPIHRDSNSLPATPIIRSRPTKP